MNNSLWLKWLYNNMVCAGDLMSSRKSGTLASVWRKFPMWCSPNKNPGHWVSNKLPNWQHFTHVFMTWGRNQAGPVWLHWERTLNTPAWFPLDLTCSPLPFADVASDLSAEINHRHKHNSKMNSVIPPKNHWNQDGLEDRWHAPIVTKFCN